MTRKFGLARLPRLRSRAITRAPALPPGRADQAPEFPREISIPSPTEKITPRDDGALTAQEWGQVLLAFGLLLTVAAGLWLWLHPLAGVGAFLGVLLGVSLSGRPS